MLMLMLMLMIVNWAKDYKKGINLWEEKRREKKFLNLCMPIV